MEHVVGAKMKPQNSLSSMSIVNNEIYLKIQTIAKDKVNTFLTEHYGRKLLEYALTTVAEVLTVSR